MSWLPPPYRHVEALPGRLAVGGVVEIPFRGLTALDLLELGAQHRVSDVGAYAAFAKIEGAPIEGVRLAALFARAHANPGALHVNVRARNGYAATLWRREIEPLAIIACARGGEALPPELGGPFRLILPGVRDEARDVWDVASIEVAIRPLSAPRNRRGLPPSKPSQPGEVQGGTPHATQVTRELNP